MIYVLYGYLIFVVVSFMLVSPGALADGVCRFDSNQGVGALGRLEPRSRVIKVSHNAGTEGARVEQLFFQETDHVKVGEQLALSPAGS